MYIWKDHTKSLTDVFGTSNNGWFFLGFHCIFPLFYALVPKYDYGFTPWITLYSQCIAYYLRVCVCVCVCARVCSVVSDSSTSRTCRPARLLYQWDYPGKNTGVGCNFLFQGIFLTQDGTHISCLLHWQVCSLPLSHLGSPPYYLAFSNFT